MLTPIVLIVAYAAAAAAASATQSPIFLPIYYPFGNYPRLYTDIKWGTPAQEPIQTVVDLGSIAFWVYGSNATLNYGTSQLGGVGPCNETAKRVYNVNASSTASKQIMNNYNYIYGGYSKTVLAYNSFQDTMNFAANAPSIKNVRVEVANYTMFRSGDAKCSGLSSYDHSILGLSPYVSQDPGAELYGPSFRTGLLKRQAIESSTLSMWFDKPAKGASGQYTFRGTALFGGIPQDKYTGPIVLVKHQILNGSFVGYHVARPTMKVANIANGGKAKELKELPKTPYCLIDSGSGQDYLPYNATAFYKASGLIESQGSPAWNGSCDSIPRNATFDYTFPGTTSGKTVTVKVPLRNYARNTQRKKDVCVLSMLVGIPESCTLGASFVSAAFLAFNDEFNQIAIAQGLVSSGATQGRRGLGRVTTIRKGQGLPAV